MPEYAAAIFQEADFVHPYSSRRCGENENTNEIILQYFPNCRELTVVCGEEIEGAIHSLSHHPKKTLGFQTSYEVFFYTNRPLTVALGS